MGLEICHAGTGCCQACSLQLPYNALHQFTPNTKLQKHQQYRWLMPKYLLTTPTHKRALAQERNSYQATGKIQIFDFLTDYPLCRAERWRKHILQFSISWEGEKKVSVQAQTTSPSWTIPQERGGGQHQFPGELLSSVASPGLGSMSFNNLTGNKA